LAGKRRDNRGNYRRYRMKWIKTSSAYLSLCIVCLLLLATAFVFAQTEKQKSERLVAVQADQQTSPEDVVIGHLQSRDKIVTISRGTKGSVYTVKTKDGKILASKLNEKDFEDKYPVLFNQVTYGLAGNDASMRKPTTGLLPPAEVKGTK
jgi:hypothetical protein